MINLREYLDIKGLPLDVTKLHVIRGKSATPTWAWRRTGEPLTDLLDYALRESGCNDMAIWGQAKWIPVLLSVDAKGSPHRHLSDAYLFLGILKVEGRAEGAGPNDCGTIDSPAWRLRWHHTDGQHLLINPRMKNAPKGWAFWADSSAANTTAEQFRILGRLDVRVACPTPPRLRGFHLSLNDMMDRLTRSNWREFLDAAGIYVIQVYDPQQREFHRYVGKATKFKQRWADYAQSGGTGGSHGPADNGNKFLAELREKMGARAFALNWRVQIVRVCDTDEVNDLEAEVKRSLCSYHIAVEGETFDGYRSRFGLNGN